MKLQIFEYYSMFKTVFYIKDFYWEYIYLWPGLLQSDEFWLLESSSSCDVAIESVPVVCDNTVSVGLRGSCIIGTLLLNVVVEMFVLVVVLVVKAADILWASIGSICN